MHWPLWRGWSCCYAEFRFSSRFLSKIFNTSDSRLSLSEGYTGECFEIDLNPSRVILWGTYNMSPQPQLAERMWRCIYCQRICDGGLTSGTPPAAVNSQLPFGWWCRVWVTEASGCQAPAAWTSRLWWGISKHRYAADWQRDSFDSTQREFVSWDRGWD